MSSRFDDEDISRTERERETNAGRCWPKRERANFCAANRMHSEIKAQIQGQSWNRFVVPVRAMFTAAPAADTNIGVSTIATDACTGGETPAAWAGETVQFRITAENPDSNLEDVIAADFM